MDEDLKTRLLAPRLPEEDVELPDVGTIRVRGLTRANVREISEGAEAERDMEAYMLSTCLVDPVLTEDEARQWLAVAPFGQVEILTEVINRISGIAKYAGKEAYKSVREEPGSGV